MADVCTYISQDSNFLSELETVVVIDRGQMEIMISAADEGIQLTGWCGQWLATDRRLLVDRVSPIRRLLLVERVSPIRRLLLVDRVSPV